MKPILEIDHNLQFTYIEKRTMEFYYLLRHDPNRIVRDKGLAEFVNFYWTDNDGEVLKVQNPSFAELENRIKELNKNNDSHPLWPELREKFKDLAATQEYRDIADKVAKAILQINLNNL